MSSPPSVTRQSLGQLVNVPALLYLGKVLRSPSLLVPHLSAARLEGIDVDSLKRRGVKYVVFDKDNTISRPYEIEVYDKFKGKVEEFQRGFPGSVAILSNSVGSSDDLGYGEAIEVERATGIPVIRHAAKKPGCVSEVMQFFSASSGTEAAAVQPHEICVIGDRLLTDVVFANANGMVSILVPQITNVNDNKMAVCIRIVERNVLLPIFSWLCDKKSL
jgi:phosphatidylglycerophosphatase GEP4